MPLALIDGRPLVCSEQPAIHRGCHYQWLMTRWKASQPSREQRVRRTPAKAMAADAEHTTHAENRDYLHFMA